MSNTLEPIFAPYPIEDARFISTSPDVTVSSKTATGVLGKLLEEYKNGQQAIDETISYHLNALAEVYFKAMEEFDSTKVRREAKCDELYKMMDSTFRGHQFQILIPWDDIYIVTSNNSNVLVNVDIVSFPYFRRNDKHVHTAGNPGTFDVVVKFDCGGYKMLHNKYELIILGLLLKKDAIHDGNGIARRTLKNDISLDAYNKLMTENFPEIAELSAKYMPDFFRYFDALFKIASDHCCLGIGKFKLTYYIEDVDGCKALTHDFVSNDCFMAVGDHHEFRSMDSIMLETANGAIIKDNISKYMYFIVAHLLQIPTLTCLDLCREIADYIEERYRENK